MITRCDGFSRKRNVSKKGGSLDIGSHDDRTVDDQRAGQQKRSLGSRFCFKRYNSLMRSVSGNGSEEDWPIRVDLTISLERVYLLRERREIFPQNEKKSVTVFSVAAGAMLLTNTDLGCGRQTKIRENNKSIK
jgi:hypothetical protein